ncbi:hypothetical protein [Legionella resiliens]|uniref:Uncharacterized protein n=1 Tax=Legionella resiliens TaxID=2905958 RepID=A0ABS8X1C8_9GAMM|nr:hypothetical protein [Legionella sp. 8cVS16]MCE3532546.1 hypothetical protein [Legionella sp. 8cVS16]
MTDYNIPLRLTRLRNSAMSRALVKETRLHPQAGTLRGVDRDGIKRQMLHPDYGSCVKIHLYSRGRIEVNYITGLIS